MSNKNFPIIKKVFVLLALLAFSTSCKSMISPNNPDQKPSENQVISNDVTREVTRIVTSEIVKEVTRIVTVEIEVPVTVTPSSTPLFTATITQTPTITLTPTETPTITPTVTNTKPPGVGAELQCGNDFLITIVEEPRKETGFYGEKSQGEFWLLKANITNLMNENFDLNDDDFIIEAELNDRKVSFNSNGDITFDWVYHHWGQLIYPWDELVAGLSATVGIGFDVNPNAENFRLVWFPRDNMFDDRDEAICEVTIPLE